MLKLWLTIVAMVAFVFLLLSILLQQFLDGYVWQQQTPQLARIATMAAYLVNQNDTRAVSHLASIHHVRIVYGAFKPLGDPLKTDYWSLPSAKRQSLLNDNTVTQRTTVDGASTMRVFVPLSHFHDTSGLIVVSQNADVLAQPLGRMRNIIYFALILGIIMATGLAFVISNNLSRPLVQMNSVAEAMALGDFGGQISVVTNDEVGRLGHTFNQLAAKLAQTIETLHVERDQLSSILTSLTDGVVATDLEGRITLANPPALRRLNSIWLEETGQPETNRLPSQLTIMLMSVVESSASLVREFGWQGRQVRITMAPLYELNGQKLRGTAAVLRDVTEERRLDRLRKDFIANVSHELRTPLSMMQGYTEALLDEFGDNPQQRHDLTTIIHDETLRMRRLVNDLLDLAQLESGQFQMHRTELDIVALLQRIARKFHALAHEGGIAIVTELPHRQLSVLGDADRLEQVFTNLLDNAIRHTPSGGVVAIEATRSAVHAQIRVSDTGSGIPREDLPFIWERFYKADKARTRGRAGIGLGLAITRHIVSEHHGDIVVDSHVGQGTAFTVILPLDHEGQ